LTEVHQYYKMHSVEETVVEEWRVYFLQWNACSHCAMVILRTIFPLLLFRWITCFRKTWCRVIHVLEEVEGGKDVSHDRNTNWLKLEINMWK